MTSAESSMSTDEKLKVILQAQTDGGCDKFDKILFNFAIDRLPDNRQWFYKNNHFCMEEYADMSDDDIYILEFLLDPDCLKAAYSTQGDIRYISEEGSMTFRPAIPASWGDYGIMIAERWLSSNGNDEATIDTAYKLLPSE